MDNTDNNAIVEQMQAQMKFVKARSRTGLIISVLFMASLLAYLGQSMWQSRKNRIEYEVSCDRILECLDQGKAREDLLIALQVIETCPDYYYAHSCLADAYLANGDVSNAFRHASIAYESYPSEAMQEELLTIRKRIENEPLKQRRPTSEFTISSDKPPTGDS
jgi:hypothetical protein